MIGALIRLELARQLASPVRLFALALLLGAAIYAGAAGLSWRGALNDALAAHQTSAEQDRSSWMADWEAAAAGEDVSVYAARAMNYGQPAILSPGPLEHLSFRHSELHPRMGELNGWRNQTNLFRRYQVEGPETLAAGRIDLAWVVVVLVPLLLGALTFDALSADRESGRLRTLIAHGASPAALVWTRLGAYGALLFALVALTAIAVGALSPAGEGGWLRLFVWLLAAAAYCAFWTALLGFLASAFRRTATAALTFLSTWAVVVLALPTLAPMTAEALHPPPSQASYLSEARNAAGEARRNTAALVAGFMADHPASDTEDEDVPGFFRGAYLASRAMDAQTAEIVRAYEAARADQEDFLSAFQFASPATLIERALASIAGGGPERAEAFRAQARIALAEAADAIGPAAVGRRRLTAEELEQIPQFSFREEGGVARAWPAIAFLLITAALVAAAAQWRLRRIAQGL